MISESENTKFGQLPAADLGAYEASVRIILGQIMAVSALPSHYIGITTSNPASADALRASEASLTARAEARQDQFSRSWEWVARLMIAVRTGKPIDQIEAEIAWADAATRSIAQEADAVVKLVQAGILPPSIALEGIIVVCLEAGDAQPLRQRGDRKTGNIGRHTSETVPQSGLRLGSQIRESLTACIVAVQLRVLPDRFVELLEERFESLVHAKVLTFFEVF